MAYCARKALYRMIKLTFNPVTQIPPLIISNFNVRFESDLAKTVVCILSTRSCTQSAKVGVSRYMNNVLRYIEIFFHCIAELQIIFESNAYLPPNFRLNADF